MNYNNGTKSEAVDVLLAADLDGIDDIGEESHHHRRESQQHHQQQQHEHEHEQHQQQQEQHHRQESDSVMHMNGGMDEDRHSDDQSREDNHDNRRHSTRDDIQPDDDYRRDGSPSRRLTSDRDDKYDHRRGSAGGSGGGRRRSRSRSPLRNDGGNNGSSSNAGGSGGGNSVRDRRVYVGNLSYDVKWTNLKDFMREIGPVAHADVLLGRDGRSKGCGVVEYQNADDARTAIRKLNDVVLMGRPVFVREDRESEPRIGFSGGRGSQRESHNVSGAQGSERRDTNSTSSGTRQIYVGNLPYSVNWKDLKDFFRRVGPVERADVFMNRENRSKGSGTVSFDSAQDVPRAICT
ncbi:hypothetical protein BG004_007644 [Podila humilis]|nr:hypothetical protein BG004_007644 [Podila humilis]